MEEIMPMIFHGFELVKDLESSFPENPPESLSDSLDSISKTFIQANDRLKNLMRNSGVAPDRPEPAMPVLYGSDQMLLKIDSGLLQEYCWSRPGVSRSMDAVIQTQLTAEAEATAGANAPAGYAATEAEVSVQLRRTETTDSGGGSGSSTPRPRRRNKEDGTQQTVLVAAPRTGITEVPPDDNYTWRKYGQKEILGAKFPRAYYRCTHQKLYNCPATKQVQRLDHDPFTLRVTYRGSHTCHISPTAPVSSAAEVADMATAMFSFPAGGDMDLIFPAHGDGRGHNRIQ